MKRLIVLPTLLLILLFTACHKDDYHGHKEWWQLNSDGLTSFRLRYDANRLLTNIGIVPWSAGPNFSITNDAQARPYTTKDSVSPDYYRYRYEGSRLARIDVHPNNSSTGTPRFFFTYDARGRMTRREGDFHYYDFATYEYAGASPNFRKASFFNYGAGAKGTAATTDSANVYIEFTYDAAHNPYSTLINTAVLPIRPDVYWGYILFDPVLTNNIVTATYYGRTTVGYEKFMQHRYSYTYENHYPITVTDSAYYFNKDGTIGFRSARSGVYQYDKLKR